MILKTEVETDLNTRNYFLEAITTLPGITLPPLTIEPLPNGEGLVDKYGKLIMIGIALLFLVSIFPEEGGAQ